MARKSSIKIEIPTNEQSILEGKEKIYFPQPKKKTPIFFIINYILGYLDLTTSLDGRWRRRFVKLHDTVSSV